jgi:hypothetical protein
MVFENNADFFHQKLSKIAEKSATSVPDWANFCRLSFHLLLVVFLKITEVAQYFEATFWKLKVLH